MNEMERRMGYAGYRFLRGLRSSSGGLVRAGVGHGEVVVLYR